jgi:hypothetical protein
VANEQNLVPGFAAGRPDQAANPPALKSGYRTRRPAPELLDPHRQQIRDDALLIETLESALSLDLLIVERITGFLEQRGWEATSQRRPKLRNEVEHLGRAVDRMARRAEQLRRARLDQAMAKRAGIVPLADAFAEIEEAEEVAGIEATREADDGAG